MDLKTNLTCPICSLIFNEPIVLPCGHSICKHHVEKENVTFISCGFELNFNKIKLVPNILASSLIKNELFLNKEEKNSKRRLEELLKTIEKLNNECQHVKNSFHLFHTEFCEHFKEIRRQIHSHCQQKQFDENRSKIDNTSMTMIKRTKEFETKYFKQLEEKIEFDQIKIDELKAKLEKIFRQPNTDLVFIQSMQNEYEQMIFDLETKLNKMLNIRNDLKANEFVSLFEDKETFGLLRLNENTLSQSQILTSQQLLVLESICNNISTKWILLYRASRDGFSSKDFHMKCDGHGNTLTLYKTFESSHVFGGFTEATWESNIALHKLDPNAFIFSLANKTNKFCKIKVEPSKAQYAIYCNLNRGPSFGLSDISISEHARNRKSSSVLGNAYKLNEDQVREEEEGEKSYFLDGSFNFLLSEIEVFQKQDLD